MGVNRNLANEVQTDPLGVGYSGMSDQAVADYLNTRDLEGPADPDDILSYVLLERYRSNTGTDVVQSNLYGRLHKLTQAQAGDDVFGESPPNLVTVDQIASSVTFRRMLDGSAGASLSIFDLRINTVLADLTQSSVWGQSDKTAIEGLSQNKRTRGENESCGLCNARTVGAARVWSNS